MTENEKVLLITGAGSGIGAATAKLLAPKYRLVLAGRRIEPLEELAEIGRKCPDCGTFSSGL